MRKLRVSFLLGVFLLSWATLAQAVSVPYIIDLPSPFNQSMGRAINTSDYIVGEMWTQNPSGPPWGDPVHPWVPFIFKGSGTAMALTGYDGAGLFNSGNDYQTQDLDNTGSFVVGYVRNVAVLPWIWDPDNDFRRLYVPAEYSAAQAVRIDELNGVILGRVQKGAGSSFVDHMVQWEWNGTEYVFTDLEIAGDGLPYNRNNINETNDHHSTTFICPSNFGYRAGVKGPHECPEPSILLLLPAALLGLRTIGRRRLLK